MRWPLAWRSTTDAEIGYWKAEANRQRERAEKAEQTAHTKVTARRTIADQYSELYDQQQRAVHRNQVLCSELEDAQVGSGFDAAEAKRTAARIARLRRVGARILAAYAAEEHRADRLQSRLDDAFDLNTPGIEAGSRWQERRVDKPKQAGGTS